MKQNVFQFAMLFSAIGFFASCKKEHMDAPSAALHEPARNSADAQQQSLTRPPLVALKLTSIKTTFPSSATFTYDAQGRIAQVVTDMETTGGYSFTTTYAYGNGAITIKRGLTTPMANPQTVLSGTINAKGQIISLDGSEESGDVKVAYSFVYDNYNRILQWTRKTDQGSQPVATMKYSWNADGNLGSTSYYKGSDLSEIKTYTYNLSQPNKSGVWNGVCNFWSDGLFGPHSKNLCTKIVTTNPFKQTSSTATQAWLLNLYHYPVTCTVSNPLVSASPVKHTYSFQ
jgi:hypothetical protein